MLDREAFALTGDLKRAYNAWCDDQQEKPLEWDQEVVPRMKQRGCSSVRKHGGRGWNGIRLKDTAEQAEAFEGEVRHA